MNSPRRRHEVESALQKKGFKKSNRDHRKFIYYCLSGLKTSIWTKTSHGSGHNDISPDNLRKMAKQCHLNKKQFNDLLDCPMNQKDFENTLKEKEIIKESSS